MKRYDIRMTRLALAAATLLHGAAALADDGVESISITAQKRSEKLLEVPAATSVLTQRDIERAGLQNIQDAAALTPNLVVIDQLRPGIQTVSFRGFTTVQGGQSPFAIVVDGVAQPGQEFLKTPFIDVQQIEVLRGPQGTLYGAGAIAGAINIVTQPPGDTLQGRVKFGVAQGNQRDYGVSLSGPITETLGFRLGVQHTDFSGLVKNETTGTSVDFSHESNWNGQLLWKPNGRLSVDLRTRGTDGRNGALWLVPVDNADFDDWSAGPDTDIVGEDRRRLQTHSLKLDYDFDSLTFTSITAYNKASQFLTADGDYSSTPSAGQTWTNDSESVSQEFRWTSAGEGPLSWNGGLFLQRYTFLDISQYGAVQDDGSVLYTADGTSTVRNRQHSWALFGQATYAFTPQWKLTAGARYDRVKAEGEDPGSGWESRHTFSELQPKLSLAYQADRDRLIYGSYSKGFRTGGFNPNTPLTVRLYDNEVSTNYELGLKQAWPAAGVDMSAAAFVTDFENQQFFYSLATSDGIYRAITNIPKTRVKGLEFDLHWRAAAWARVSGSVGYNDTEIRRFDAGQYDGNRVPQVYGLTTQLSLETQHQVWGDRQLVTRVDWAHRGDVYWDLANTVRTPSKDFFNARIALEWSSGEHEFWQLALVGRNLTDERTPAAVGANALGTGRSLRSGNTPRQIGAELQWSF